MLDLSSMRTLYASGNGRPVRPLTEAELGTVADTMILLQTIHVGHSPGDALTRVILADRYLPPGEMYILDGLGLILESGEIVYTCTAYPSAAHAGGWGWSIKARRKSPDWSPRDEEARQGLLDFTQCLN